MLRTKQGPERAYGGSSGNSRYAWAVATHLNSSTTLRLSLQQACCGQPRSVDTLDHRDSPCTDVRERATACSRAPHTCISPLPAFRACSCQYDRDHSLGCHPRLRPLLYPGARQVITCRHAATPGGARRSLGAYTAAPSPP
jgi:hypothetical protein